MRITDSRRSAISATDSLPPIPGHFAADGFANFLSKYGHGTGNQGSQSTYVLSEILSRNRPKLDAMYRQSWVCGKVVDTYAEDMTRAGITISGSITPTDTKRLQKRLARLGVWSGLLETIKWGRLYGGAIAFMDIDGQDPSTPLMKDTVGRGQFKGLRVFDRHQCWPDVENLVPSGPKAGLPSSYSVVSDPTMGTPVGLRIHHSRCVRYQGIQLPRWQAVGENLWGESILERMFDRLLGFDTATAGAANLVHRAHLRVARVKDFRKALVTGGEAENDILKFFRLVAYLQGTEGITVLDAEDEYAGHTYTFAGLSDVLLSFGQQLSGASDIPLVKFFGQSPAGLNATGESDIRNYYDGVNSQQKARLEDPMETLLDITHRSELGCPPADDFDFDFAPLWQMSAKEKAEIAKQKTDTVVAALGAGAITPVIAMKELQQMGDETGVFTNITDEDIEAMALAVPPMGSDPLATIQAFINGDPLPGSAGDPEARIRAFVQGAGAGGDPLATIKSFLDPAAKIRAFVGEGDAEARVRAFAEAA
jgi:phage-related protein (TIGR01555 family)